MTHIARWMAAATALVVPLGLATVPTLPATAAPTSVTFAAARVTVPTFSDPTYLPIRRPARVSCVRTNCRLADGRIYHGDWAIDFLGDFGDPIMAAGYGVAHVGGYERGCRENSGERRGNWVWIDHGGGQVTYYYHLKSISISSGQPVTPDTKIGEMGGTGAAYPCKVPYLHFERRITNKVSQRVEPANMWACLNSKAVSWPQAAGSGTWNMPKLQKWVMSDGTGCLRRPARAGQPMLDGARPNATRNGAVVSWRAPVVNPQLVTGYRVSVSLWHPSTHEWDTPVYYSVAGKATSVTVPGLQYRRTYRIKVAARDAFGASAWTGTRDLVIAKAPGRPPITKLVGTKRTVRAVWKIPPNGGNKITTYVAALSRGDTVVRTAKVSPKVREVTWTGLQNRTRFSVDVLAVNQAGWGPASRGSVSTK